MITSKLTRPEPEISLMMSNLTLSLASIFPFATPECSADLPHCSFNESFVSELDVSLDHQQDHEGRTGDGDSGVVQRRIGIATGYTSRDGRAGGIADFLEYWIPQILDYKIETEIKNDIKELDFGKLGLTDSHYVLIEPEIYRNEINVPVYNGLRIVGSGTDAAQIYADALSQPSLRAGHPVKGLILDRGRDFQIASLDGKEIKIEPVNRMLLLSRANTILQRAERSDGRSQNRGADGSTNLVETELLTPAESNFLLRKAAVTKAMELLEVSRLDAEALNDANDDRELTLQRNRCIQVIVETRTSSPWPSLVRTELEVGEQHGCEQLKELKKEALARAAAKQRSSSRIKNGSKSQNSNSSNSKGSENHEGREGPSSPEDKGEAKDKDSEKVAAGNDSRPEREKSQSEKPQSEKAPQKLP